MIYLGIDYGKKKIGLALSEGMIASPFQVVLIKNLEDGIKKLLDIIKKERADVVVVGVPEGKTKKAVLRFTNVLKNHIKVVETEEVLSSKKASHLMVKLGVKKKERRKEDAYAAAIILQNYLDEEEANE